MVRQMATSRQLIDEVKQTTTDYNGMIQSLSPQERGQCSSPHCYVWLELIKEETQLADQELKIVVNN